MNFEITGRLADKFETQIISDRFQKREFVLESKSSGANGFEYVDYIKFQTTQDKCSLLDQFNINDMVKVTFNLRGRKWEKEGQVSYFTNLEAWRIDMVQNEAKSPTSDSQNQIPEQDAPFPTEPPEMDPGIDDLPF